jgi:hypothetical protein
MKATQGTPLRAGREAPLLWGNRKPSESSWDLRCAVSSIDRTGLCLNRKRMTRQVLRAESNLRANFQRGSFETRHVLL